MSTPLEFVLGITAASIIGVGSIIVVLDTTAKREVPERSRSTECVQQGETLKCTPKNQAVTGHPMTVEPASALTEKPPAAERIDKVEETLSRIMKRLDRIEEKVEEKSP